MWLKILFDLFYFKSLRFVTFWNAFFYVRLLNQNSDIVPSLS